MSRLRVARVNSMRVLIDLNSNWHIQKVIPDSPEGKLFGGEGEDSNNNQARTYSVVKVTHSLTTKNRRKNIL